MTTYSLEDTIRHEKIAVLLDMAWDFNLADVDDDEVRPAWTTAHLANKPCQHLWYAVQGLLESCGFTAGQSWDILENYLQFGSECGGKFVTGVGVGACIGRFLDEAYILTTSTNENKRGNKND